MHFLDRATGSGHVPIRHCVGTADFPGMTAQVQWNRQECHQDDRQQRGTHDAEILEQESAKAWMHDGFFLTMNESMIAFYSWRLKEI